MVGRFSLPSLPSFPAALADLLDTSPQVFYPPSRPASRQAAGAHPPGSSCPPSPRRSQDDTGALPPLPPPPHWSASAHPHTDAPLGHSRSQSVYSLASYAAAPQHDLPQSLSHVPPRRSSLQAHQLNWKPPPSGTCTGGSSSVPRRPAHKRSQSAAPGSFHAPTLARLEARSTASASSSRQLVSNTSAASLPTLAEDASASPSQSLLERSASDRERRQAHPQQWLEPAPVPPRPARRRAQSSVTFASTPRVSGTFVEPALPDRLRRHRHSCIITSSSTTVALSSEPPTLPGTPTGTGTPRTPRSHSRANSVSSLVFPDIGGTTTASPSVATASVSVSDIAAQATWSQEPISQASSVRHSRSNSIAADSPSESLRQRLRSLSELDQRHAPAPSTPSKRHSLILSPATPRSTHATPGHGASRTPGSCTPTSNSCHAAAPPQSPTPRRYRPSSIHRHSLVQQLPDERDRPTTTRLRQPTQLSMGPGTGGAEAPRSRPQSMLEAPSPMLISSPMLGSSPGSLVSDSGSSPTTSIESLPCMPSALRERPASEQNRSEAHPHPPSSYSHSHSAHSQAKENTPGHGHSASHKRMSWQERRRSGQSTYGLFAGYTMFSDGGVSHPAPKRSDSTSSSGSGSGRGSAHAHLSHLSSGSGSVHSSFGRGGVHSNLNLNSSSQGQYAPGAGREASLQQTYAQAAATGGSAGGGGGAEWRRPGVAVAVLDDMEGERFLDFDDI